MFILSYCCCLVLVIFIFFRVIKKKSKICLGTFSQAFLSIFFSMFGVFLVALKTTKFFLLFAQNNLPERFARTICQNNLPERFCQKLKIGIFPDEHC